jgi:hypothetical protein
MAAADAVNDGAADEIDKWTGTVAP